MDVRLPQKACTVPVYTHGHHESVLRSHRWRTVENSAAYLVPYLTSGKELLDVGCGPGTITADFAQRLSPGRVRGVDSSADAINAARLEHPGLDFATGDVKIDRLQGLEARGIGLRKIADRDDRGHGDNR